ncbi:MAG: hypothetical protein ACLQVL_32010, partial [Terriglobia bacterium]
ATQVDSKKAKYPQTPLRKVHYETSVPYGQDRLIPIWVATLALQQKDRTIHFDSAAQMLDFFRLPKDGPHYQRLVSGFQRIFAATIFFGTEETPNGARPIDFSRFHFVDRMRLCFNSDPATQTAYSIPHATSLHSARLFTRKSTSTLFHLSAKQSPASLTLLAR